MTEITFDHIFRHFRSIHNFFFVEIFHEMAAGGHFGRPKITFDRISRHFRSIRNFLCVMFFKMAASGHFGFRFFAKVDRDLPLGYVRGYVKYEVDRCIFDEVMECTSFFIIFLQNSRRRPFGYSDFLQNR